MSRISPFSPFAAVNMTLVANTTQTALLPAREVPDLSGNNPVQRTLAGESVKIDISGTVTGPVFIKFGGPTVVAAATDIPVIQNPDSQYFTIPPGATHIAAISVADTPVVRITVGSGGL